MAFWQFNTGFQVWTKPSFWTWVSPSFSTGFSPSISTNTTTQNKKKSDNYTYNPRYPWFDEEDYKKLEQMVAAKGLTWDKKTDVMDQLYKQLYPRVLNKHKLDERQQEINNSVYQNWELLLNGNTEAKAGTWITTIAQEAKKRYNIPYNVNDQELVDSIVADTKDWNKLLYEYVNNWNPEIFYAAGIWDRPQQQWGTMDLVNQASTNDKSWGDKNLREKWETVTNYTNLVWYGTEKLDDAANKFADKLMVTWETAANNLKTRLENLTPEQVEQYRQQYINMINWLEEDDDYTGWEATGDLLSALWHGTAWHLFWTEDKAYEAAARLTQSNKKEDGWYVIDKNSRLNEEDFKKWLISQEVTLGESLIGADDILKWETNPNVIRFFSNIPSSAVKTFTATVRGMTNPYDTLKWLYTIAATEEWHQAILQRYGSWEAFANAINTDPVWVADDMLAVAELVAWGIKWVWKMTWNESLVNKVNSLNIWSANDALAQKTVWWIYWGMNKIADMTNSSTVNKVNNFLQTESSLSKMNEARKDAVQSVKDSSAWQAVKNWKDEMVDKIVWIDEKDREFIRNNKEIVNEYLDWKKNVETVFDNVKEKISEKRLANSEMWKEYGELRKNKSKVVNTEWITNDMKKNLKNNGITIDKNWNLKFSDMSKFNAKQKAALVDAWNELKMVEGKKNINAWNVLDMRQKFDDKLNWDGKAMDLNWNLSSVDKATEWLIQDMRWVIDNRAKTSVAWLKELDAKYADALAEMQQIKKDRLNPDWSFKDSARSKLRNLTKAWNEEKLARLEKAVPWITNDLKALDVWLTVERATKQWVWQYSKSIWVAGTVWALASWNIPALLTSIWVWILATPKNFVRVLETYPDIVAKLQAWQELLPSDMNKLQSFASRIQDWVE